jgi:hypothetical protein
MSITELEQQRHAEERGIILRTLQQEYSREMTTVRSLAGALDLLGYPMSVESLQFSLLYLAERGFVRVWRAREMPGWRPDRQMDGRGDTVVCAKLLAEGVLLLDALRPADPGVRF